MPRVTYSSQAEEDLVGIVEYIARDKPAAARRWLLKIHELCETLASQPGCGEERLGFGITGCRSFSAGSYVIFFRTTSDGIDVARIIHGNRDMTNL